MQDEFATREQALTEERRRREEAESLVADQRATTTTTDAAGGRGHDPGQRLDDWATRPSTTRATDVDLDRRRPGRRPGAVREPSDAGPRQGDRQA